MKRILAVSSLFWGAIFLSAASHAQFSGVAPSNQLHNLSLLKPPVGHDVAIYVFEDLGCPACAHAHPIEEQVSAESHVPLMRKDFPFQAHIWTFQGAVYARYIQERISPKLADQYRDDVFKAQRTISNKDDLMRFTQEWLQRHGQLMPFVADPTQQLAQAVQADFNLGQKINLMYTPTIVVVTKDKQQVVCGTGNNDYDHPEHLLPIVEAAMEQCKKLHSAERR